MRSLITLILISTSFGLLIGQDHVSNATGLGAIREITASDQWCERLEISPGQRARLRQVLESSEFKNKVTDLLIETLASIESLNVNPAADKLAVDATKHILLPDQLTLRRRLYLKDHYLTPMHVFYPDTLNALCRDDPNLPKLLASVPQVRRELDDKCRDELKSRLAQLFVKFPSSEAKWIEIFGPTSEESMVGFSMDSLGVLDCTAGGGVLSTLLFSLQIPFVEPLTPGQRNELRAADDRISLQSVKPNFPLNAVAFDSVRGILTEKQLAGLVLLLHKSDLHHRFPINDKRVLEYLKIAPGDLGSFVQESTKLRKSYLEVKLKNELFMYEHLISMLAEEENRRSIVALFEGVWNLESE